MTRKRGNKERNEEKLKKMMQKDVHLFRSGAAGALRRRKKENGERGKLSSQNDGVSNVKLGKIGKLRSFESLAFSFKLWNRFAELL